MRLKLWFWESQGLYLCSYRRLSCRHLCPHAADQWPLCVMLIVHASSQYFASLLRDTPHGWPPYTRMVETQDFHGISLGAASITGRNVAACILLPWMLWQLLSRKCVLKVWKFSHSPELLWHPWDQAAAALDIGLFFPSCPSACTLHEFPYPLTEPQIMHHWVSDASCHAVLHIRDFRPGATLHPRSLSLHSFHSFLFWISMLSLPSSCNYSWANQSIWTQ